MTGQPPTSRAQSALALLAQAEAEGDVDSAEYALSEMIGSWDPLVLDQAHRCLGRYAAAVGASAALVLVAANAYPYDSLVAHLNHRSEIDPDFAPPFAEGLFKLGRVGFDLLVRLVDLPDYAGHVAAVMMRRPDLANDGVATALRRAIASGRLDRMWGAAIHHAFDFIEGRRTMDLPVAPDIGHREKVLIETRPSFRTPPSHTLGATDADLSPDGFLLATCGIDRNVRVWDVESGQPVAHWNEHSGMVYRVGFANESTLISAGKGGMLVIDLKRNEVVRKLQAGKFPVVDFRLHPERPELVAAEGDAKVRVWNHQTGKSERGFQHADLVGSVAFSPRKQQIVTACDDGTVRIWATEEHTQVLDLSTYDGPVRSVDIGRDGRFLCSATNKAVTIWDLTSRAPRRAICALTGHKGKITTARFHPTDPSILLTVSADGMARIRRWRIDETIEIIADGTMTRARFASDGKHIVSSSVDGSAAVWPVVEI